MPFYHELLEKYPHTLIQASGECVGLPKGVMGNSNVGHLCMGAGRVVPTDVEHIGKASTRRIADLGRRHVPGWPLRRPSPSLWMRS